MKSSGSHKTVLLEEACQHLVLPKDGIYIDATYGRGGHSDQLLKTINEQGCVLAFDKDPAAIEHAEQLKRSDSRFDWVHESFASLQKVCEQRNWVGKVAGILFDLGVSSPQLDDAARGFSFLRDGPLDMRMDPSRGVSMANWLAHVDETTLIRVLRDYGEERFAKRIARAIIVARGRAAITTTGMLSKIIAEANPKWEKDKHPATRSFQALRIFINDELGDLEQGLQQSLDVLSPAGRLVVISFHSLEDRIVKRFMRRAEQGDPILQDLPIPNHELPQRLKRLSKGIKPSRDEIVDNTRARSAVMRVAEKVG